MMTLLNKLSEKKYAKTIYIIVFSIAALGMVLSLAKLISNSIHVDIQSKEIQEEVEMQRALIEERRSSFGTSSGDTEGRIDSDPTADSFPFTDEELEALGIDPDTARALYKKAQARVNTYAVHP